MTRREIFRSLMSLSGILNYQWNRIAPGLYAFNYHRIGDAKSQLFDPNIFSCNETQFSLQIDTIRSKFRILDTKELVDIISRKEKITEHLAVITFDDGYVDNYTKAFPILKSKDVTAVFFLPTNFIGSTLIPWWEEIAWIIRHTTRKDVQLPGWATPVKIDLSNLKVSIRNVLANIKIHNESTMEEKLASLRDHCACEMKDEDKVSMFMSWDQVRTMLRQGMDIGSHGCSHRILAHLTKEEQRKEIAISKEVIETQIGSQVISFAYPVGGKDSYTPETKALINECGFRIAFTFPNHGFSNSNPSLNPFEISRLSVGEPSDVNSVKYAAISAISN